MVAVSERDHIVPRFDERTQSDGTRPEPAVVSRVLPRVLEAFFGHPIVCMLPLVVFTALGLFALRSAEDTYESSLVAGVSDQTLLSDLTNLRPGEGFGWETPAAVTARRINELLGTDDFVTTVVGVADLGDEVDAGALTLEEVRESIGASPVGSNLVRISATSEVPDWAPVLAEATFESFVDWVLDGDVAQSAAAEEFFRVLVERYEQEVLDARSALEDYVAAHPVEGVLRPPDERAEVDRLTTSLELAQDRYGAAVTGVQEAQLAVDQSMTDVSQRLRLVDPPQLPQSPESGRKDMVISFALFVAVGAVFSLAIVGAGAFLDRSLRTADDVQERLGVPVLAVVPDAGARAGRR